MLASDVAIVRDDARLADHHGNFGLVPGGGSTQRLPPLVGHQRALGLILSGARLTGAEAVAWDLAFRAAPADGFDSEVDELVDRIRRAPATIKRLVGDGTELSLAEALARERAASVEHFAANQSMAWPSS